jgi:hypothetical protein
MEYLVASGPCLIVNLSAGVASGRCPIDKFFAHKRAFTDHSVNRHRAFAEHSVSRGREFMDGLINLLSE